MGRTLRLLGNCLLNYKLGALLTSPWLLPENGVEDLLCSVMEKLVSMCYELCPHKGSFDEVLSLSALECDHIWR